MVGRLETVGYGLAKLENLTCAGMRRGSGTPGPAVQCATLETGSKCSGKLAPRTFTSATSGVCSSDTARGQLWQSAISRASRVARLVKDETPSVANLAVRDFPCKQGTQAC